MRTKLILTVAAAFCAGPGSAHALFPARQTVNTFGVQGWATLKAINGRTDVTEFVVEVFEGESWTPSRSAVTTPERLTIPASRKGNVPVVRNLRVLVHLRGQKEREVMVCTKSVPKALLPSEMVVNTRVCSRVRVRSVV